MPIKLIIRRGCMALRALISSYSLGLHPLHQPPGSIRGHVLNCRKLGDDQFRIGMEFDTADGPTLKTIRHAFYPDDALNDCL